MQVFASRLFDLGKDLYASENLTKVRADKQLFRALKRDVGYAELQSRVLAARAALAKGEDKDTYDKFIAVYEKAEEIDSLGVAEILLGAAEKFDSDHPTALTQEVKEKLKESRKNLRETTVSQRMFVIL
jgi:hypothetical protein